MEQKVSSFKKWYDTHRDKFNARRRARYLRDKEYREQQLRVTREWRSRRSTNKTVDRLTIGDVAKRVKRTHQTIREWETRGYIPRQTTPGGVRCYTEQQVQLIEFLAQHMDNFRQMPSEVFFSELKRIVVYVHEHWSAE